jgi:hypothetical protein
LKRIKLMDYGVIAGKIFWSVNMVKSFVLFLLVFTIICTSKLNAQFLYQDVLYLKDGEIIRGDIIEQNAADSLKLKKYDGDILILAKSNIIKTEREAYEIYNGKRIVIKKQPGKAFLLSFFLPGLGQYYNADWEKGLIQQCLFVVGTILFLTEGLGDDWNNLYTIWAPIGLGIAGTGSIWSIIDAPNSARRINRQYTVNSGKRLELYANCKYNVLSIDPMVTINLTLHF